MKITIADHSGPQTVFKGIVNSEQVDKVFDHLQEPVIYANAERELDKSKNLLKKNWLAVRCNGEIVTAGKLDAMRQRLRGLAYPTYVKGGSKDAKNLKKVNCYFKGNGKNSLMIKRVGKREKDPSKQKFEVEWNYYLGDVSGWEVPITSDEVKGSMMVDADGTVYDIMGKKSDEIKASLRFCKKAMKPSLDEELLGQEWCVKEFMKENKPIPATECRAFDPVGACYIGVVEKALDGRSGKHEVPKSSLEKSRKIANYFLKESKYWDRYWDERMKQGEKRRLERFIENVDDELSK